jgi:hypothetical protein
MSPASHKYVDQQKVYNLIGREILDNAWYLVNYAGKAIIAVCLPMGRLEQENHTL